MPSLTIRDLVIEYRSGDYVVRPIDGLSMDVDDGELVVLLGPSGSGKTTLLSCLGALLRPAAGSVIVDDVDVCNLEGGALNEYRRRRVGFVFQAFNLIPSLTAEENVAAPLLISKVSRREASRRARELLAVVGMADRTHHKPGNLSGGQQQRVAVARGLAHDPPLLLADEPTANLDYIQAETVIRLLRDLARPGRLTIVSTHDQRIVPIADRVVELIPQAQPAAEPVHAERFDAGTVIFRQGSRGQHIYVIDAGEVDIVRERADGGHEHLATLSAGQYFGELGPLLGFPRTATAVARTDVMLMAHSLHDFKERVLQQEAAHALPPV